MSNEDLPESPSDGDLDEESLASTMPWLKVLYMTIYSPPLPHHYPPLFTITSP